MFRVKRSMALESIPASLSTRYLLEAIEDSTSLEKFCFRRYIFTHIHLQIIVCMFITNPNFVDTLLKNNFLYMYVIILEKNVPV